MGAGADCPNTLGGVLRQVFGETSTNVGVYEGSAAPLIGRLFNGQSSTCFAYGATGAGKT